MTDFGLAQIEANPGLTMTGELMGTLRYMSPEQTLAKRVPIDHRTDIYSLGVTLYESLTLQPAFAGNDRQVILQQIVFEEPPPPRRINNAIPADLETIVLKATAKDPRDRYATAQELADDLRRFLEHKPIQAKRPSLVQRTAKWSRRHQAITWSAVVILVLATIGLGVSNLLITWEKNAKEIALNDRVRGCLLGLMTSLMAQADYAQAESLWRETLGIRRKQFGDEHHSVTEAFGWSFYYTWYQHALFCLRAEDREGYRQACTAMLKAFAESQTPSEVHFAAWTCVFTPDAVDDYSLAIELAERAVKVEPKFAFYQQCLGAVLFRAGRFNDALEHLNKAAESQDNKWTSPAYAWYFLAMTHHKLGHQAEAKQWFDKAVGWTERVLDENRNDHEPVSWNRRLTLELLHSEAEELLDLTDGSKTSPDRGASQ